MGRDTCLLCGVGLTPLSSPPPPHTDATWQQHPDVPYCGVRLTDAHGVSVDDAHAARVEAPTKAPALNLDDPLASVPGGFSFTVFPPVEDTLVEIFKAHNVPRLGGVSTGRGWSNFSLFQRCPYAWSLKYERAAEARPSYASEIPALVVGTLVHTYLAVMYMGWQDASYPLTPEDIDQALRLAACNPVLLDEGWRVFAGYRLMYGRESFTVLAVEQDLVDPRTHESCRYDLIAYYPEPIAGRPGGTYVIEHKTSARFDVDTLDGWINDGEILGQLALWHRLKLDRYYGRLQGVLVNIIGKQKKDQQFHRTWVKPSEERVATHLDDLRQWEGLIQLARHTRVFPRARAGCIGRYGRCNFFDHCAGVP